MKASEFLGIAADGGHWDAPPAPTVPRSVPLPSTLRSDVALIIQGVRRCGKSTLFRQLVDRYYAV